MGMRRRSSQKQQQSAPEAAATGAFAETAAKASWTKRAHSDTATTEKSAKGVCRRSAQRQQQRAAKASKDAALTEATPRASQSTSQNDTSKLKPTLEDVLASIESLYADELKPFGRILRKRVAECALLASGVTQCYEENLSDVDVKYLHTICQEEDSLQVQPEEGGDWSVTIIGRPDTFVDVYSSVDAYPEGMWGAASAYFQLLSGDDMYLPGGRYSCAQELQGRSLAFLGDKSLGQVCHIVQLAISQKKLLGYLNGAVVPYAFSQSMLKEQCAQRNTACGASGNETASGATDGSLDMATWDIARQLLREILNDSAKSNPDMVGMVPLSNVKRLFRSKFQTELSETKLGHSKLTQLLQDHRFSDICEVQLQGHGYIVIQVVPQEESHTICLQHALPADEVEVPSGFCSIGPISLDMNESGVVVGLSPTAAKARWPPADGHVRNLVQRTFIHAALPPPTPPPNARRRSASLPKDAGSVKASMELQCVSVSQDQAEETDSTVDSAANGSDGAELSRSSSTSRLSRRPSGDDPIKVMARECNLAATMEPMKIMESADVLDSAGDVQSDRRLQWCPGEPLVFDEVGFSLESAPVTQTPYTPTASMWSCLMPSAPATEEESLDTKSNQCRLFCPDEPLAFEEAEGLFDGALFPQTPFTPGAAPSWPCLLPPLIGMDGWLCAEQKSFYIDDSETPPRFQFCPDEPLDLEEAGAFVDAPCFGCVPDSMSPQQSSSRRPCHSPSSLVRDGCFGSIALSRVQNTFIHSPAKPLHSLPPTPLRASASRRSRSLPKNVGSDKNLWEATCQALGCSQIPRAGDDPSLHSGDCPKTPSVYVDYIVPPSPDFPTYCNKHQLGSDASAAFFAATAGNPELFGDYFWPASSAYVPSVIRLADFLQ